ncbi:MAG: hypothetical protein U0835_07385 [Isosphaeraceae bacterium]
MDPTDRFVPRFHAMLEGHIRGRKQALLGNLRGFPAAARTTRCGTTASASTPRSSPRCRARASAVKVEMELEGNAGASLNGQDAKPRVNSYVYTLVYGLDGNVDETQAFNCDWISVGGEAMYCPLNILEVVETKWQGHNPYITEANVRALDLANGGNYSRFAGAPPQFRPVVSYEAGRSPMFANRLGNPFDSSNPNQPRRGGLFHIFGGR